MFTHLLGIIGSLCFAYCGVPAAIATWKAKKSVGTPIFITIMIILGSIFMYSYLLLTYGFDLLLAINYAAQLFSWGLIARYHYFPKA